MLHGERYVKASPHKFVKCKQAKTKPRQYRNADDTVSIAIREGCQTRLQVTGKTRDYENKVRNGRQLSLILTSLMSHLKCKSPINCDSLSFNQSGQWLSTYFGDASFWQYVY